ncbi:hypothetical protein [Nostoc sp. CHAB 5715]|uniref:hypothetical protein n=1 Tax=Nostoc sp. CHAB 5715 TaxID=2780400 RepID=UPI001E4CBD03|nr:hypothetical protein [Nostoc sp. CHAB 5715]MCC5621311.1 hypothetical protein [Nostoc sp. CHAB 5715]
MRNKTNSTTLRVAHRLVWAGTPAPWMYIRQEYTLGLTKYAEKLNGRLAVIGFISLIALEILTGV